MGVPKCNDCEYCSGGTRSDIATRKGFYCEHPNRMHIKVYFEVNKIYRAFGFIGFGEKYADYPAIKTSPRWCPKRYK